MKKHSVTDKRLIAVIFSEVTFLGGLVLINDSEIGNMLCELQIDQTDPANPKIKIPSLQSVQKSLNIEFLLNGKRFRCVVEKLADSYWAIPNELAIEDRRTEPRHNFKQFLGCEILTKNATFLGHPISLTSTYIAVSVPKDQHSMLENQNLSLIIYGTHNSSPITLANCRLFSHRPKDDNSDIIILTSKIETNFSAQARSKRAADRYGTKKQKSGPTIKLEATEIEPNQIVNGEVTSLSLTGFTLETDSIPLPGVAYYSLELDTNVHFVRQLDTNVYAFIIEQGVRYGGKQWKKFIERHTPLLASRTKDINVLNQFLIECGFIKGERRKKFGQKSQLHVVDEWFHEDLFKRYLEYNVDDEISAQASAIRFSTSGWLLQEGSTGLYKKTDITSFVRRLIRQLRSDSLSQLSNASQFATIYDPNIKPVDQLWSKTLSKKHHRYSCVHLNSKNIESAHNVENRALNSTDLKRVADGLSVDLIQFFGLHELALSTSDINRKLKSTSHEYQIETLLSSASDGDAIVYRLKGPYTLNVSGLISSVFILPLTDCSESALVEIVSSIKDHSISKGTSDVLVVTELSNQPKGLKTTRIFHLLIDDIESCAENLSEPKDAA